ncbi:MAG: histone deacetylase [Verrucomicrobia bacterium]|nr:histone deacetylase [Verrucomicrobiota bacterium]
MSSQPTGIYADPGCRAHVTGVLHPEAPERYDAIINGLHERGLLEDMRLIEARDVTKDVLISNHTWEYIGRAEMEISSGAPMLSTGDTAVCPATWNIALKAVGGAMAAVDAVVNGDVKNAFCLLRPPGHHATPDTGMGFCVFNNVALAARHAQKEHGIERILIADWDVHHGNGTQDAFYDDPSVFFFSTHQSPWYPFTGMAGEHGVGAGEGTTLNYPFPAGSGSKEIVGAFEKALIPAMDEFKPELVLVSAGFDSRLGDPLGDFTLTDDDFSELTNLLLDIARRHAAGRLVATLEGGYSLNGLAAGVAAHVETLMQA